MSETTPKFTRVSKTKYRVRYFSWYHYRNTYVTVKPHPHGQLIHDTHVLRVFKNGNKYKVMMRWFIWWGSHNIKSDLPVTVTPAEKDWYNIHYFFNGGDATFRAHVHKKSKCPVRGLGSIYRGKAMMWTTDCNKF